jgi:hydroxyacylglutathione hydrolase
MHIKVFCFSPFQQNTHVVFADNGDAVIIDPSCYEQHEENELKEFIASKNLSILAVLNTHCHVDHVFGNDFCVSSYKVDLICHKDELFTLEFAERSAQMYGLEKFKPSPEFTRFVADNEKLTFGDLSFQVIFGPGHSVGHIAFYNDEEKIVIGGDILFQGSFGRVDLPGGDIEILKKTIHERMFTLPDDVRVYPGHGSSTTIGQEKDTNYILQF